MFDFTSSEVVIVSVENGIRSDNIILRKQENKMSTSESKNILLKVHCNFTDEAYIIGKDSNRKQKYFVGLIM